MNRKTRRYLKQLDSPEPQKRYEAVLALGQTGNLELLDELDRVANLDDDPRVRHLAGQAVEVFSTLKRRELERERAALMADDDGTFDWPELAQEKILQEREHTAADQQENWSYVDSKKKEVERLQQLQAEQQAAEEAARLEAQRRAARRRRPFRILTILAIVIAVLGLIWVVYYQMTQIDQPDNREDALLELQAWVRAQQETLVAYDTAFELDTLNCEAAQTVAIPEKPAWVEQPEIDGLEPYIERLTLIQDRLVSTRDLVQAVCPSDQALISAAEVEASSSQLAAEQITYSEFEAERILQSINQARLAASEIEQALLEEQTEAPPAEPDTDEADGAEAP